MPHRPALDISERSACTGRRRALIHVDDVITEKRSAPDAEDLKLEGLEQR
jgi:hypothetical protein